MRELLYGYHPVREALRAGRRRITNVFLSASKRHSKAAEIRSLAAAAQIPVQNLHPNEMTSMVGAPGHQGVCATAGLYACRQLNELLANAPGSSPLFLLADQIVDPQNLGALIRTACCAGLNGVILTKDRSAGLTPAVSRASAGAMEHMSLARVTNLVAAMKMLKKSGIWIAGLQRSEGQRLYATDLTGPLALVVGSEEKGMRTLVKKHCDLLLAIPQSGSIDSLNASVAGGVVMYEAFRQRNLMAT